MFPCFGEGNITGPKIRGFGFAIRYGPSFEPWSRFELAKCRLKNGYHLIMTYKWAALVPLFYSSRSKIFLRPGDVPNQSTMSRCYCPTLISCALKERGSGKQAT